MELGRRVCELLHADSPIPLCQTDDIIMPPIGMAIGNNLVNLFLVIQVRPFCFWSGSLLIHSSCSPQPGRSYYNTSNVINGVVQPAVPQPPPYATLDEARADKAVTWVRSGWRNAVILSSAI